MKSRNDAEVAAWFEKAKRDLRMAELAIEVEDPMPDQACFHAQQCAEKSLKALIVATGLAVPRTHALMTLLSLLSESFPSLDAEAERLAELTSYGVTPRYPSWLAEETLEEASEAIQNSRTILKKAQGFLDD